MIGHVGVDLADGPSLFDDAEKVNREHFLVGKVGLGIVALTLRHGLETVSVLLADEQVNPYERMLRVHVAKGGFVRRRQAPSSNRLRRHGFFNP